MSIVFANAVDGYIEVDGERVETDIAARSNYTFAFIHCDGSKGHVEFGDASVNLEFDDIAVANVLITAHGRAQGQVALAPTMAKVVKDQEKNKDDKVNNEKARRAEFRNEMNERRKGLDKRTISYENDPL